MSAPKRVRLSRAKGARLGRGVENVARPTRWGNPYVIDADIQIDGEQEGNVGEYSARDPLLFSLGGLSMTPAIAVALYAKGWDDIVASANEGDEHDQALLADAVRQLRGKDLACWCPLDAPCHADVLLRIVNA